MRNSKASSGVLGRDAFRIIKICVLGISMVCVPLFVKPALLGTYEFLSMAIPRVSETVSSWLTPTFLYLILNCIILAIVANSGVGILNFHGATSNHHEENRSPYEREKESQFKPNINPIVHENNEKICREEKMGFQPTINPIVDENNEKIYREVKGSQTESSMPSGIANSEAVCEAESLEDTWKSIIEARRLPPARQLRKADTWATHRPRPQPLALDSESVASFSKFGKSETWNSGRNLDRQIVGAEMLKKEPSLGQDELNEKIEAFIAKVNHDMKLQREKSLLNYMEMVNRGSG